SIFCSEQPNVSVPSFVGTSAVFENRSTNSECRPLLYCRYIDNCFIIFALREKPNSEWLPFLNVQISISPSVCATKW
ncbi:unnamed protein product, partial [Cylicocyclus nassatus]